MPPPGLKNFIEKRSTPPANEIRKPNSAAARDSPQIRRASEFARSKSMSTEERLQKAEAMRVPVPATTLGTIKTESVPVMRGIAGLAERVAFSSRPNSSHAKHTSKVNTLDDTESIDESLTSGPSTMGGGNEPPYFTTDYNRPSTELLKSVDQHHYKQQYGENPPNVNKDEWAGLLGGNFREEIEAEKRLQHGLHSRESSVNGSVHGDYYEDQTQRRVDVGSWVTNNLDQTRFKKEVTHENEKSFIFDKENESDEFDYDEADLPTEHEQQLQEELRQTSPVAVRQISPVAVRQTSPVDVKRTSWTPALPERGSMLPPPRPVKAVNTFAAASASTSKSSSYVEASDDERPQQGPAKRARLELDYDQEQLKSMSYDDLASEPFDYDPRAVLRPPPRNSAGVPMRLEEQLANMGVMDDEHIKAMFAAQNDKDWEETGGCFMQEVGKRMTALMHVRHERRTVSTKYEQEIKKRNARVAAKQGDVEKQLRGLKAGGSELMKSQSPVPKA